MGQFDLVQRFQELVGPQVPQTFGLVELTGRFRVEDRRSGDAAVGSQFPRGPRDSFRLFKRQFVPEEPFVEQRPDAVDVLLQLPRVKDQALSWFHLL